MSISSLTRTTHYLHFDHGESDEVKTEVVGASCRNRHCHGLRWCRWRCRPNRPTGAHWANRSRWPNTYYADRDVGCDRICFSNSSTRRGQHGESSTDGLLPAPERRLGYRGSRWATLRDRKHRRAPKRSDGKRTTACPVCVRSRVLGPPLSTRLRSPHQFRKEH